MTEYKYILIPLITVILTQIIKFIVEYIKTKKWNWKRLLNGNGGMPSSHTSFAFSLATAIGIGEGFQSPIYAISLVFACIVGYDAMGLRMESGKQAQAINLLTEKVFDKSTHPEIKNLKEQLGHKPLEVMIGILFGAFMAILLMNLL